MGRFKFIPQNDETDCGPACLAGIFRKYGLKVSIAQLRDIAGTDRQGTSAYGLVRAAEHYRFQHKAVNVDNNALTAGLPLPAIAHVIIEDSLLHYVVIKRITKNKIIISDPARGTVTYKRADFLKIWTGFLMLIAPKGDSDKGNKRKSTLISFFKLMGAQKLLIAQIFSLSLILTAVGIITTFFYKMLMDDVLPNLSMDLLNKVSLYTLSLFIIQMLLGVLRGLLVLKLERNIDIPIMLGYYNHALLLPMKFYAMRETGEIISRFNDASNIRDIVSDASLTIMMDAIMAVFGAIVLFNSNRLLFLIAVVMLILYAIIVFAYNKPIKKINRELMEMNSKVTSQLIETINGIETVKAFNQEKNSQEKTDKLYKNMLKKVMHGGKISLSQSTITSLVGTVGELLILWIGAMYIINNKMTLGELITFNALLAYFIDPITNLIGWQPRAQSAIIAADRLGEILDITPEFDDPKILRLDKTIKFNKLTINNLSFRYGMRDRVLNNINMTIKCGERVAFVGESGSGKTTLAKLLSRLYEQESGTIKLDGKDIRDYPLEDIRNNISYVSQDTFLFSGTIKENLLFGNPFASDEEIDDVCKVCELSTYIDSLPLGYNTRVEENGKNLSGGQRQRLAIARALLKNPKILIMDEATSNLDSISEKAIERTINGLSKNITVIVIAHRLSTVINCNRIFVFGNGQIVEEGTHKQLIDKRHYYFDLCKEQMVI